MRLKNKIKEITLNEAGIVLHFKNNDSKQLLYSELSNIYISASKTKPFYEFFLILMATVIATAIYFLLGSNIVLTAASLLFFSLAIKLTTYKRYLLHIYLKNGATFERKVQAKSKHHIIDLVNEVKKHIFEYKLKASNEELLKKIAI